MNQGVRPKRQKPDIIKILDDFFKMEGTLEKDSREATARNLEDRSDKWIKDSIKTYNKTIEDYVENEEEHGIAIAIAKQIIWYKWVLSKRKDKK